MSEPTTGEKMLAAIEKQTQILEAILEKLMQLTNESAIEKPAPNYVVDISAYETYDWSSIGAEISQTDRDGVAMVVWRGKNFMRRSAQNKFQPAIWYSRSIGKDETGENTYERLITFKQLPVPEALPKKAKFAVSIAK
jgi:hypothetical protein